MAPLRLRARSALVAALLVALLAARATASVATTPPTSTLANLARQWTNSPIFDDDEEYDDPYDDVLSDPLFPRSRIVARLPQLDDEVSKNLKDGASLGLEDDAGVSTVTVVLYLCLYITAFIVFFLINVWGVFFVISLIFPPVHEGHSVEINSTEHLKQRVSRFCFLEHETIRERFRRFWWLFFSVLAGTAFWSFMIFFQGKLPEDPTGLELAWSIFFKINCLVSWLVLIRMVVFIFQAKDEHLLTFDDSSPEEKERLVKEDTQVESGAE